MARMSSDALMQNVLYAVTWRPKNALNLVAAVSDFAEPQFGLMRSTGRSSAACSALKFQRADPVEPFLVKIWITPFEASVPYSVAAAAPFSTSMRSMDDGSMSSRRDGAPPL